MFQKETFLKPMRFRLTFSFKKILSKDCNYENGKAFHIILIRTKDYVREVPLPKNCKVSDKTLNNIIHLYIISRLENIYTRATYKRSNLFFYYINKIRPQRYDNNALRIYFLDLILTFM